MSIIFHALYIAYGAKYHSAWTIYCLDIAHFLVPLIMHPAHMVKNWKQICSICFEFNVSFATEKGKKNISISTWRHTTLICKTSNNWKNNNKTVSVYIKQLQQKCTNIYIYFFASFYFILFRVWNKLKIKTHKIQMFLFAWVGRVYAIPNRWWWGSMSNFECILWFWHVMELRSAIKCLSLWLIYIAYIAEIAIYMRLQSNRTTEPWN